MFTRILTDGLDTDICLHMGRRRLMMSLQIDSENLSTILIQRQTDRGNYLLGREDRKISRINSKKEL